MHEKQYEFCLEVKRKYPKYFYKMEVLDVGSLDINGDNRYLFGYCSYVGMDIIAGPNVDIVCPVHLYAGNSYDIIICTEMLEHDRYWRESIKKMIELARNALLITCATGQREEHGTFKNKPEDSLATNDYYQNVDLCDFRKIVKGKFKSFILQETNEDLYFWGIK